MERLIKLKDLVEDIESLGGYVFIYRYPHVSKLSLSIYINGWDYNKNPDYNKSPDYSFDVGMIDDSRPWMMTFDNLVDELEQIRYDMHEQQQEEVTRNFYTG